MTISISSAGGTLPHGHTVLASDGGFLTNGVVNQNMTDFYLSSSVSTDLSLTTVAQSLGLNFTLNAYHTYIIDYFLYYTLALTTSVLYISFTYPTLDSGGMGIINLDANNNQKIVLGTIWNNINAFTSTSGLCIISIIAVFSTSGVLSIQGYYGVNGITIKRPSMGRVTVKP